MNKKRIFQLFTLTIAAWVLFSGCIMVDREFRMMRNEIIDSFRETSFKRDVEFQIGMELLLPAKIATNFIASDPDARAMIGKIHNIQVGVFKVQDSSERIKPFPPKLEFRLRRRGYQPIIKVKSKDENVWVFVQMQRKRLKGMYVIALDRDELVLVEMKGKLGELIQEAVRERDSKRMKASISSNFRSESQ